MNFKRYLNENRTALNWNNINRVRLQKNSRPGFSLGYGEAFTCALARVDRLPLYDIYEPKSQKSRRIFKFLQFRTKRTVFRESSTFFATGRRLPYTIYTNQNHKYHAERTKRAEIHLMKGEDEAFLFARRANKNRASFSPVGK